MTYEYRVFTEDAEQDMTIRKLRRNTNIMTDWAVGIDTLAIFLYKSHFKNPLKNPLFIKQKGF